MLGLLIIIFILILFFNPKLLPGMGSWLGGLSRKPFRQSKWMWSWFAGTEDELIRAERDYGLECARAFAKQFSGSVSGTDQELAANIGSRLAGAAKDPRREFRFTVAFSTLVNAFALPGGFVFITGSLLDLCEHENMGMSSPEKQVQKKLQISRLTTSGFSRERGGKSGLEADQLQDGCKKLDQKQKGQLQVIPFGNLNSPGLHSNFCHSSYRTIRLIMSL